MRTKLAFIFILLSNSLLAQNAVVYLNIDDVQNFKETISYTLPVFNNFSVSLSNEKLNPKKGSYLFSTGNLEGACFAKFYRKNKWVYLLLEPNDSIIVNFKKVPQFLPRNEAEIYPSITFGGNKAEIHRILNEEILILPKLITAFKGFVKDKKITNFEEYFKELEEFKTVRFQAVDSLCTKYNVSDNVRNVVKSSIISNVLEGFQGIYFDVFTIPLSPKLMGEYNRLEQVFIEKHLDILSKNYSREPLGEGTMQRYIKKIYVKESLYIKLEELIIPPFMGFDGQKYNDFFPKDAQDAIWAEELIATNDMTPGAVDLKESLRRYEVRFPKSPFLPLIKQRLTYINMERPKPIFIDTLSKSNSVDEFFETYLSRRNKHILIDLWATWCVGCKLEFKELNKLTPFLENNNIDYVFLSVDEPSKSEQWKQEIIGFGLNGFHSIVNEKFKEDIKNKFYKNRIFSIPRYIFISQTGLIVIDETIRPSDGDKLIEQLTNALKKL